MTAMGQWPWRRRRVLTEPSSAAWILSAPRPPTAMRAADPVQPSSTVAGSPQTVTGWRP
jgi:hypothetical protein